MAQLVTAIMSHQDELAAAARRFTGDDVNETSLLVGRVITRAFRKFDKNTSDDAISSELQHDLERVIAERRLT